MSADPCAQLGDECSSRFKGVGCGDLWKCDDRDRVGREDRIDVVPYGHIPGGLLLGRDFLDLFSIALCIRGNNFRLDSLDSYVLFADSFHKSESLR